jgi:hypothetical protein
VRFVCRFRRLLTSVLNSSRETVIAFFYLFRRQSRNHVILDLQRSLRLLGLQLIHSLLTVNITSASRSALKALWWPNQFQFLIVAPRLLLVVSIGLFLLVLGISGVIRRKQKLSRLVCTHIGDDMTIPCAERFKPGP